MPIRAAISGCHHAVWLFLLWQFGAHFGAAETGTPSPEYLVRGWQMEDGLPDSSVKTILQTREGYLWVGTDNGLARFDGVQFKTFNPQNTPALRSGRIRCLLQDRRGVLWVGTDGGELAFLAQGKFQSFSPDPGRQTPSHIAGLLEDSNGAVWACVGGDELVLVRSGAGDAPADAEASVMGTPVSGAKARRAGIKVPGAMTGSPAADSGGRVWIPTGEGLCAFDGARLTREAGLPDIQVVARKPGGGIWTGGANWLRAYESGEAKLGNPEVLPWAAERSEIQITALCADQAGGLWVGTFINGVVYRERQGAWRYVVHDGPLFQNIINCIFEDREGTIWIGTEDAGLYRVRRRVVSALPLPPEFRDLTVLSAWAARDGSVWLGTEGAGVFRYQSGRFTRFAGPEGLASLQVYLVIEDSQSNVWAATREGLFRSQGGQFRKEERCGPVPGPVKCLFEDRSRRLWVGGTGGAACLEGEKVTWFTNGMAGNDVRSIVEDAHGSIWMAAVGGGLYRFTDGQMKHYGAAEGLPSTKPVALLPDRDGTLWIGTYQDGLIWMKDGHFTTFTTSDGLVNNVTGHLAEDKAGNLWIGSVRGLMRISQQALKNYRPGSGHLLPCLTLTIRDGLFTVMCSGGSEPAMSWDAAGRLWLPNLKAVAVVDPGAMPTNEPAPPLIEEVLVNGQPRQPEGGGALKVQSGQNRIEVHYTSLNLAAAEHTRFQVKLEGWDNEWIDSGFQRAANYRALPPGEYTFRVMAGERDGSWREALTPLALRVVPRFWETWWFRGGLGLAILCAVAGGAQLSVRRRARLKLQRLERVRALEQERARIAQDIHDELGAGLAQIGLLADVGGGEPADWEEARRSFSVIAQRARATVTSLDEIIWAVNPKNDNLPRFAEYLCRLAEELFESSSTRCFREAPPTLPPTPMRAEVRHNLTLAVKEALTNTLRHAQAAQVRLSLGWSDPHLEIVVEDNGCGFDPGTIADRGNGLANQVARLHKLGGVVELDTKPGRGTKTVFRVRLGEASE